MKKSVKALTFAAAAMATSLAFGGCVYGPQPTRNTTTAHTETKESERPSDTTLPSGYDPTKEMEVDVYGPPPEDLPE